ncbi:MAG: hypothetical protein EOO60_04190 [Hymenobacter sp.]|nr:MAG: hypothetical protein EOO60_04190 [Hymenobacter sp.]
METSLSRLLLTLVSAYLLGFTCQAQVPNDKVFLPRYYADVQLSTTYYELFFPGVRVIPNLANTHPWKAVIGRQLTAHWAVQLGYAYTHEGDYDNPAYTGTTLSGQHLSGWQSSDTWMHAVSLVVRYGLLRSPDNHFQIDILGGSTWVRGHKAEAREDFIDGQSQGLYSQEFRTQHFYVTLGLAARYVFSRRFEGVFEYGRARNLKTASEAVHLETTGNKWGLTRSMSLGVRYRFNMHKVAKRADNGM